jgi:hypothetical protein
MAMSGVEVDPECKQAFDDTLMGKKFRYVTYKIDSGRIRIDKVRLLLLFLFSDPPAKWSGL